MTAPAAWANRIIGHGVEAPDQLLANPRNWRIHPKQQQDALSGLLDTVGLPDAGEEGSEKGRRDRITAQRLRNAGSFVCSSGGQLLEAVLDG